MKTLIVTKDKGAFAFLLPGVRALIEAGHDVKIVAEGLSAAEWKKAEIPIFFEGTEDFRKTPFECDPEAMLRETAPDVVIVGTSVPMNLEDRFALAANRAKIPVIAAEDTYLAAERLTAALRHILAINGVASDLVRTKSRYSHVPTTIVGSPAVEKRPDSEAYTAEIARLRDGRDLLVLYAGHGQPYTVDILEITLDSVRKTVKNGRRVGLVLKHHPKIATNVALLAHFETLAGILESDCPGTILETPLGSNDLAWEADVTVSHHGTALNVAAAALRLPVSVRTPATAEAYRKEAGLGFYVLASAGAAATISEATDLYELWTTEGPKVRDICMAYPLQEPPAPDRVVRVVGSFRASP